MPSLRHSTLATGSNNPDKQVSVTAWNQEHNLTGTANYLLGFDASGNAVDVDPTTVGSTTVAWGNVTGTLTDQTDLSTALGGKEPSITSGTTGQYWRGDKSWQTLDNAAVGLGNVTNDAQLPLAGGTLTGSLGVVGAAITVENGASAGSAGASKAAFYFGWNSTANFRHALVTRHNTTLDENAFDFYLHKGGTDADDAVPSLKAMTLDAQSGLTVAGAIAATGAVSGSNLSGTNTGDQTITLTGDVTGSGTGSFAATVASGAVTLAKIANASASSRLLGSGSSGSGAPYSEVTLGTGLSMSGTTLNVSPRLFSAFTSVGTDAATTEKTLQTYTLPGGTLATNGQAVRVIVRGKYASTSRSRQLRLYFGATVVTFMSSTTASAFNVTLEAIIMRTGATTQIGFGPSRAGASNTTSVGFDFIEYNDPAETLASDVIIKVTGQVAVGAVANDITCDCVMVELLT